MAFDPSTVPDVLFGTWKQLSGTYVDLATREERAGLSKGHRTASGSQHIASLLQRGTVIQGTPFFCAWMEPGSSGFVDGDGSLEAFQAAVNSGVP